MMDYSILSFLIFFPMACASFIVFVKGDDTIQKQNARNVALFSGVLTIIASLFVIILFDLSGSVFQLNSEADKSFFHKSVYSLGIDGISLILLNLFSFVFFIAIILIINRGKQVKSNLICLLLMQTGMNGSILVTDILMFYIFFELTLFPLFYLIFNAGDNNQKYYVASKFLVYNIIGSVLLFSGIIYIYYSHTNFIGLDLSNYTNTEQMVLWWMMFVGFMIKVPFFPLHNWFSLVFVNSSNAVSTVLSGAFVYLGLYGVFRFLISGMSDLSFALSEYVIWYAIFNIFYIGFIAILIRDFKKMISYNVVIQMSLAVIGVFSFSEFGLQGVMLIIVSQVLVSVGLLICAEIMNARDISYDMKSFSNKNIVISGFLGFLAVLMLCVIGAPGTIGFAGEFLVFSSIIGVDILYIVALFGMLFPAIYTLNCYRRMNVFYQNATVIKMNWIEKSILLFVSVLIIGFGLFPAILTGLSEKTFPWIERVG